MNPANLRTPGASALGVCQKAWKMLEELGMVKAIDSEKNFRYYVLNKENGIVKTILKLHAQLHRE